MKSFVKNLIAIWAYKRKSVGFSMIWLACGPLVFLRYVFSDLVHGRFRNHTASLKTHLVRKSVYQKTVEGR